MFDRVLNKSVELADNSPHSDLLSLSTPRLNATGSTNFGLFLINWERDFSAVNFSQAL